MKPPELFDDDVQMAGLVTETMTHQSKSPVSSTEDHEEHQSLSEIRNIKFTAEYRDFMSQHLHRGSLLRLAPRLLISFLIESRWPLIGVAFDVAACFPPNAETVSSNIPVEANVVPVRVSYPTTSFERDPAASWLPLHWEA